MGHSCIYAYRNTHKYKYRKAIIPNQTRFTFKNIFHLVIAIPFILIYNGYNERGQIPMAKQIVKQLVMSGYHYVDTIFDDDFIYDIYELNGRFKKVCIGTR